MKIILTESQFKRVVLKEEDLKNIETDLIRPDYAEDVFDQLSDSETMNEGIGDFFLTAGAIYSFYKFIKGVTGNDTKEAKKSRNNIIEFRVLNYYIKQFIKDGGKLEYNENYLNHEFLVGDVTIKINKENNTMSWTYLMPDKFLTYKPGKRLEFTDIDVIEHEYTEPIQVSQEEVDELIKAVKHDIGDEQIDETTTLTESDLQRIVKKVLSESSLPMSDFDHLSDDEFEGMIRRDMENMNRGDEFTYYDPTNPEHPFGGRYVNDSGWWDTHNRPEYSGEWEDYEFDDFTELKRSDIPNQNYRKLRTRRDFDTLKNPKTGKVHIRKRRY